MSFQTAWAQALLDSGASAPDGLRTWNGSDPTYRLGVYRNNAIVSLVDALACNFPIVQQLVGDDFFRAMAQRFVRQQPPRTPVLSQYGSGFADFVAGFAPASSLPYLAGVARLEWLRLEALHAVDSWPVSPERIAACLAEPEAVAHTRWTLAPCLRLFADDHAAVSLWLAHQKDSGLTLETVDVQVPESAWIFRSALDVVVLQAASGAYALAQALQAGIPLGEAVARAQLAQPDADIAQTLAQLMRHGLVVDLKATRLD